MCNGEFMTDDAETELAQRLRAAALVEAEYQKTETERKIKLAEAEEYGNAGTGSDPEQRAEDDRPEGS